MSNIKMLDRTAYMKIGLCKIQTNVTFLHFMVFKF